VRHGQEIRCAARRLTSTLAFGGSIAAMVTLHGNLDLENYETAFVSLDRGTAMQTVQVLGHPVYTLALGLGVRLPLHGSLGASPASMAAPYLPEPLTYWLLLTLAVASAVLVVRHALEPMCGRLVSWLAMFLLFWSVPVVNYTITADWPETAVTYCAVVACAFAPHALLALWDSRRSLSSRLVASLSLTGVAWGLIGVSHPGYWPILGGALVLTGGLALCRSDHPLRTRLMVVAALGTVSLVAVALQLPDITREIQVAGPAVATMERFTQGPTGSLLLANLFPFGQIGPRLPFTFLVMTLVSLVIGLQLRDTHRRRLVVGSALISILCGVGAATLDPRILGSAVYAPSSTSALRDPAVAFAVLSAACAAGALPCGYLGRFMGAGTALAVLLLAGLQGPLYAARVVEVWSGNNPSIISPRGLAPAAERASTRGLARDYVSPGGRLALWPGVRESMRNLHDASTEFADAGYILVTTATKQRTMRGLVEPNRALFNQAVELSSQVLCDARAVQFLQLQYLLAPQPVECDPWRPLIPPRAVDTWLDVLVPTVADDRVRALPVARLSEPVANDPALSASSSLLSALIPLPGTSVSVGPRDVVVLQDDLSRTMDLVLVLPVAYDSAWTASTGQVHNVGGLLALVGGNQHRVVLTFVPDSVAILRAVSMTLAQFLTCVGLLGLAYVRPFAWDRPVASQ
jgi:hypothetical protein